jgi:hypothetical protein
MLPSTSHTNDVLLIKDIAKRIEKPINNIFQDTYGILRGYLGDI